METKEFLKYREDLLNEARDEDNILSDGTFLQAVIPSLLDAKLIDSEDLTETFYDSEFKGAPLKINGYIINDSQERLQLFIVNSDSLMPDSIDLEVTLKDYYQTLFKKCTTFITRAVKGYLNDIEDIGAINALISQMSSSLGAEQFDAIEIFLVSATSTVSVSNGVYSPKRMDFKDESIKVRYTKNQETIEKDILIIKRLIDLNFLHSVLLSQGSGESLFIDFKEQFDYKLEAIKAADEDHFESYLCVLSADILSQLYLKYSSRLLEKNVRSFLQFRGVNRGMRKTLTDDPEKFIAYNNGLTITAKDKEVEQINGKLYITSLSDFQIVNGGQTTASIYFSKKDGIDISKVKVMAKINVAKNVEEDELNELISNISQFSNSQSKVSNVDLRSRNPQLAKIKVLSESVLTPSGDKWFFEKSKGEFNTKLRIAGSGRKRIEKEYPSSRRFTKELLGKYYCSWGNEPYKVKKGGEAIFRKFIEEISNDNPKDKIKIDRDFYESLISRIILFRSLETLHGTRSNAIGQLRSAVIPYTIAIIYNETDGNKKNPNAYNLSQLWLDEQLSKPLSDYLFELMTLMNDLIKKYAKSDDLGEYSKKEELWKTISESKEIISFMGSLNTSKIFSKYIISKKEIEKKNKAKSKVKEIDFQLLIDNINVHSKTSKFYEQIENIIWRELSETEKRRITLITDKIKLSIDIDNSLIEFEKILIRKIRTTFPDVFENISSEINQSLNNTFDFILSTYNTAQDKSENILSRFQAVGELAKGSGAKYDSVFEAIGKDMTALKSPSIKQLVKASHYVKTLHRSQ